MESLEGMAEGLHKAKSGLIRVLLRVEDGKIEDLIISGDFILVPEHYIDGMEKMLIGSPAMEEEILSRLKRFFELNSFQSPSTYPEDFTIAIMKAIKGGANNG